MAYGWAGGTYWPSATEAAPAPAAPAAGPRTSQELQDRYGFDMVTPDSQGGFYAYQLGSNDPIRFVRDANGFLVQEAPAPKATGGGAASRMSPDVVKGAGGNTFVFDPNTNSWTNGPNVGQDPNWTQVNDARTGSSRLVDANSGQIRDLGQTGYGQLDPRETEGQRRLEADRLFAYQQSQDAQQAAQRSMEFEANQDLQNRQLTLQGATALTTLAESQEARKREILKGATDYVYRSFTDSGQASPTGKMVTQADLINNLAGEFDRIASIYQEATKRQPLSSNGRLATPQQQFQMSPPVSAAPSGGSSPAPASAPAASAPAGVQNWSVGADGQWGSAPAAPAPMGGGGGGAPGLATPSAPAVGPSVGQAFQPLIDIAKWLQGYAGNTPTRLDPSYVTAPTDSMYASGSQSTSREQQDYQNMLRWQRQGLLKPTGGVTMGEYADGGRAPADEPYIVGEGGFEIAIPQPDGTTHIIPNEIAKRLVDKKSGKLKGYEDGTFFSGWGGQDATAAIRAFQASQAAAAPTGVSTGASPGPTASYGGAPAGAMTRQAYDSRLAGVQAAYPGFNFMDYNTAHGLDANGNIIPSLQYGYQAPTQGMPSQPNANPLQALIDALRPKQTTQADIIANEQRLRPPTVDALVRGEQPNMPDVRSGVTGDKLQVPTPTAFSRMRPEDIEAYGTYLGTQNQTLENMLVGSRYLYTSGANQRRLRTAYR